MHNTFKRLAIISDCVHTTDEQGQAATENHIFCRQMQALAKHFEHTVIVCPFVKRDTGSVTTTYSLPSIAFIPLPDVGGDTLQHKLQIIQTLPAWLKAFKQAKKMSDIVYLRMPNNLNIPGFFYYRFGGSKMFATYTGTWKNYSGEPPTYRFQKWLLKYFFKGPVWIYTQEAPAGSNLFKGISPSYSEAEWHEETAQVDTRIKRYGATPVSTFVFITVGALVHNKNQQYILNVCKSLKQKGFPFYWYIVGDGALKQDYQKFVTVNGLQNHVNIAGKKTYGELRELYRQSHFLVQATLVEGFGKAPVEAMFHGVIPILSNVAMAKEMTAGRRGYVFDVKKEDELEKLILQLSAEQNRFKEMITAGRDYVRTQTLESWAGGYIKTINEWIA